MSDDSREYLRMQTLTPLWLFSRHVYSIGGHRLWIPISHRMIGWSFIIGVPVWLLLKLANVPVMQGVGLTGHFVLPGFIVWAVLRWVAVGRKPGEMVSSWARLLWHVARHWRRGARPFTVSGTCRTTLSARPTRVRER